MANVFESWEGGVDDTVLGEVRELWQGLRLEIRRLGRDPTEEDLAPLLEHFCQGISEIDQEHGFITPQESQDIRDVYEELAVKWALPIVSLDDLDEPPSW